MALYICQDLTMPRKANQEVKTLNLNNPPDGRFGTTVSWLVPNLLSTLPPRQSGWLRIERLFGYYFHRNEIKKDEVISELMEDHVRLKKGLRFSLFNKEYNS